MRIRCPHCHQPIELVQDDLAAEVLCSSCGSSFSLISGDSETIDYKKHQTLGQFELIERVGMGKFGAVWKARDTQLKRIVAVKVPRKDQLDATETEMFFREARTAAQLKHPNIVGVHEVGREGDSLYIVSDFVQGANLREWLSAQPGQRLTPREAAELCAKIADAVAHAHAAGVVHRDLKPGNIMLDTEGNPHITDFGLAKREAGEITMTLDGAVLGTPAYMSPEQARGQAHQADARSDVYSLGVILFELLTGELPFRGETRMLVVQILNDEPPSPRKLNARVPRDLETICLKCLEKDPKRRYSTANELFLELRRFVDGKPIVARPIGRTARAWRWCKRKPAVATLLAAVFLSLSAGIGVSSYLAVEADKRAMSERAAREQSWDAIEKYVKTVADDSVIKEPRFQRLRKKLLADAAKFYEAFFQDHISDETATSDVGNALVQLGGIQLSSGLVAEGRRAFERAAECFRELSARDPSNPKHLWQTARAYERIGISQSEERNYDASIKSLTLARSILERIAPDTPLEADIAPSRGFCLKCLGESLYASGRTADALKTYKDGIALMEKSTVSTGTLDERAGLYYQLALLRSGEERVKLQERARDIFQRLVRENPNDDLYKLELATVLRGIGDERSLYLARNIMEELFRRNSLETSHLEELANVYTDIGNLTKGEDAVAAHKRANEIWERIVSEFHDSSSTRLNLASSYYNLGMSLHAQSQRPLALKSFESAIEMLHTVVADHLDEDERELQRITLPECYGMIGQLTSEAGHGDEALTYFDRARDLLVGVGSLNARERELLAGVFELTALSQSSLGHHGDALKSEERSVEIRRKSVIENPESLELQKNLARSYKFVGNIQNAAGHPAEALRYYDLSRDIWEQLARKKASGLDSRSGLADIANAYRILGTANNRAGSTNDALTPLQRAVAILERVIDQNPDDAARKQELLETEEDLMNVQSTLGDARAEETIKKLIEIRGDLLRSGRDVDAQVQKMIDYNFASVLPGVPVAGGWDVKFFAVEKPEPGTDQIPLGWEALVEREPLERRHVDCLTFRWEGARPSKVVPASFFGVTAHATIDVAAGKYEFCTIADDGIRVKIDGRVVLNHWSWQHALPRYTVVDISPGTHRVDVEYFQLDGNSRLEFGILPFAKSVEMRENLAREDPTRPEFLSALADLYRVSGYASGRRGKWKDAANDYRKAVQCAPGKDEATQMHWYVLAALLVEVDDVPGFTQLSKEMMSRFEDTKVVGIANRTCNACLLIPDTQVDWDKVNKLCEVFGRQDTAWDEYVKSLVEYRQGRFASAVDWAKKAIKRDNQYPTLDAQIYAVLAMSQHRLGHEVEAHASLIKGEEIAATRLRKRDSGDLGDDWHDWLKSDILLREAKRLLDAGAPRGAAAERTLECAVAAG